VNVRIDEARDHKLPCRIDECCAGRRLDGSPCADLLDAFSLDDNGAILERGPAIAVDDRGMVDDD